MSTAATQVISDAAIHGGEPVIEGTSTPVRAIAELWNQGMPAEELPVHLPHLTLPQVFECRSYYLTHRDVIDGYTAANRIPDEWRGRQFEAQTEKVA
jgi:uncharacterized protein (DUF433 family)